MPKLRDGAVPAYRHHKRTGQAIVTLNGKDIYLGLWKSSQSRVEYDRVIAQPIRAYGRNDFGKVCNEVQRALAPRGLDLRSETVVVFQLLLNWNGAQAEEIGPYVGTGNVESGTAWVYDDEKLDACVLRSKEQGGWYGDAGREEPDAAQVDRLGGV